MLFFLRLYYSLSRFLGFEVEQLGNNVFAIINKREREDAWFSYHAQLRSIIEKFDVDLVIDVGANEGQFVRQLRTFYSGRVLSFEPVCNAFEKLSEAASTDASWQVYKMALGSENKTQTIHVSDFSVFSSLLKTNDYCENHFGKTSLGKKEEVITIRRLDEMLNEIIPDYDNKRIFLKIDTQGYDIEVFKGAGAKLNQVIALQSEASLIPIYENAPHWTEAVSLYEQAGFGVVGMFPVNRDAGQVIEYDCLLSRRKNN